MTAPQPGDVFTRADGRVVAVPNVNVLIPERHLVEVDSASWRRLVHHLTHLAADSEFWWVQIDDPATFSVRVRGYLPPLAVTALMALAQGHPLGPIVARIPEEV